jgi:hypothetical protein
MSIIFNPNERILSACDHIDEGIELFLRSKDKHQIGKFEYEVECLINITHITRIVESILELARKDLVYIQSAFVLSRTVFETALKASWMLQPTKNMEKECRYVSQLNTEVELWNRWLKELEGVSVNSDDFTHIRDSVADFSRKLASLLEDHGYKVEKLPNVREMLKSLSEQQNYKNYILLSQYTHMTHYAGNIYRKHLGSKKVLSEEVRHGDWQVVLSICWSCFEKVSEKYFLTVGGENLYGFDFKVAIRNSIDSIEQT